TALLGVQSSAVAWGDYNNDGELDILLTGIFGSNITAQGVATRLYKNNGDGTFSNVTGSAFPGGAPSGVSSGVATWADYNNDSYLDFLVAGTSSGQLFRNNGDGTFTNVTTTAFTGGLLPVSSAAVAWGDYNSDGALDLLYTGFVSGLGAITQLWRNGGTGTF